MNKNIRARNNCRRFHKKLALIRTRVLADHIRASIFYITNIKIPQLLVSMSCLRNISYHTYPYPTEVQYTDNGNGLFETWIATTCHSQ